MNLMYLSILIILKILDQHRLLYPFIASDGGEPRQSISKVRRLSLSTTWINGLLQLGLPLFRQGLKNKTVRSLNQLLD